MWSQTRNDTTENLIWSCIRKQMVAVRVAKPEILFSLQPDIHLFMCLSRYFVRRKKVLIFFFPHFCSALCNFWDNTALRITVPRLLGDCDVNSHHYAVWEFLGIVWLAAFSWLSIMVMRKYCVKRVLFVRLGSKLENWYYDSASLK